MQFSFFLYVSVQKLQNLSHLQPNGGWTNSNICYRIGVHCTICDIQIYNLYISTCEDEWDYDENGDPYHVYLCCPFCKQYGGLKILMRRGGPPIKTAGESVAVMEVQIVGLFWLHEKAFVCTEWIATKSDGSYLEPFLVDDKGDYVSWDSDIEDWIEIHGVGAYLKPTLANYAHRSWMREKPLPDSDSDLDSTSGSECYSDSDTDSE